MKDALLKELTDNYNGYFRIAYSLTNDYHDASDVLQDVCVILLTAELRDDIEHPHAYLCTVIRNAAYRLLKNKPRDISIYYVNEGLCAAEDTALTYRIDLELITSCLAHIPEDVRAAVIEHLAYGTSLSDLARKYALSYKKLRYWRSTLLTDAKAVS